MTERKPRVFIGSSSEGKKIARILQLLLSDAECEVWDQGAFGLSEGTLESLVKVVESFDFAVLVATPDDMRTSRDSTAAIPRDNVIFELGLCMGAMGRERAFVVYDRMKPIALPSDLAGVSKAPFEIQSTGRLETSVAPAATLIQLAIERAGPRPRPNELHQQLAEVHELAIATAETGPEELAYFDKLAQLLHSDRSSRLAVFYADVDGLRAITQALFLEEKRRRDVPGRRLGRRPEAEIRAEFLTALSISLSDALYTEHPRRLKHDIFLLPDPDAVMLVRELAYDDALNIARCAQRTFREESKHLWGDAVASDVGVSMLVGNVGRLRELTQNGQAANLHAVLQNGLQTLKEKVGRGRVFGHDDLAGFSSPT